MSAINKINKLVFSNFSEISKSDWLAEDFQKKLKKALKTKKEKSEESMIAEKKPHSPYIQFCIDERPVMKQKYPNLSAKQITAKLGEQWNNMKLDDPAYLKKKYNYEIKKK